MSNDWGFGEAVAHIVLILLFGAFVLAVGVGVIVRCVYRVEGVEDSRCRTGYLYILTEDDDGARSWKSTEAKCEVEQ